MKKILFVIIAVFLFMSASVSAQIGDLPRSAPEAQGVPSAKVIEFLDSMTSLKATEIHSVILMRNGYVIAEIYPTPFAAEYGHAQYSCSKTFVSAAIGMAVEENRLRLSDRLASFFPELLPDSIGDRLANITIRDLLTMTSGFRPTERVRNKETEWVREYLANEIVAEPGTRFAYDSMDTYLLSAVIQRVTGQTLLDYLQPRLFEPLHIEYLNWEWSPEGITCGGWGLYLQAESMAKFGQLLLNKGEWNGRQLIPSDWVDEMMYSHVKRQDGDDYCFQMWKSPHPNTSRADGAFGQFIIVMPDEEAVLVVTQCFNGNGSAKEMEWLFDSLLPSFDNSVMKAGKDSRKLADKVYSLPYVDGKLKSKHIKIISESNYSLCENSLGWKTLSLTQDKKHLIVQIQTNDDKYFTLNCGYKEWRESDYPIRFTPHPFGATSGVFAGFDHPFIAKSCFAWQNDSLLMIKTHIVNWMSGFDVRICFDADRPYIEIKENYKNGYSRIEMNVQ